MEQTKDYVFFWGPKDVLSNFYPINYYFRGKKVKSSEEAFMLAKALHFNDMNSALKLQLTKTPKEAKAIGRLVKNYDDAEWNRVRYDYMVEVLTAKFLSNKAYARVLVDTFGKTIVEASPYDEIWGIKISINDPDRLDETKWKGQNLLGKALMEVRDDLIMNGMVFPTIKKDDKSLKELRDKLINNGILHPKVKEGEK